MNTPTLTLNNAFEVIEDVKHYNFNHCLRLICQMGKEIYNPNFVINSFHKPVYFQLLSYAVEDHQQLEKMQLDPKKGLLLMGASGTGKTAMMHLCKNFFTRKKHFAILNSKTMYHDFSHRGFDALMPIINGKKPICLDNLGKEPMAKHFGTNCDTVYTLVEHFYENRYQAPYPLVHLITDLDPLQLEKRYGFGFRKMLQELCNVIVCE